MDALSGPLSTRADFAPPAVRGDAVRVATPPNTEAPPPVEVRVSISAEARAALASTDATSGASGASAPGTPADGNVRPAPPPVAAAIERAEARGTSTTQENPALALYLRNASVPDDRAPTSPLRTSA